MPPPVLVRAATTLDALAVGVPGVRPGAVEQFWPGPLTLVCHQQPSLQWDLGDTRGTVAVRMPDHEVALELLARTGPLAVSSRQRDRHARPRPTPTRPRRCSATSVDGDPRRRPDARRRGLDDRRRHRSPGPGAAPAARSRSSELNEVLEPLGVDIDGRGLRRRLCASTSLVFLVAAAVDLPADGGRPRDRAAHRRGGQGPRPRRARRADPVLRRAGDARRAGRGVPRGPPAAVPVAAADRSCSTTPASCSSPAR